VLRLLECWTDEARGGDAFREIGVDELPSVRERARGGDVVWVDLEDATKEELDTLSELFGWHQLISEGMEQGGQRQKAEQFGDLLMIVVHLPRLEYIDDRKTIELTEIDLVVGDHWLVSSHSGVPHLMDEVAPLVRARADLDENGAMAVVTTLFDRLVDKYEEYADRLAEKVEEQDRELLEPSSSNPVESLRRTAEVRHAVLRLRRATGQLRELVGVLVRHELVAPGHTDALDLELRDVYDHVVRAHDDLDILYERLASLADTRLALTAYTQNEITKKLSAWGAILLVPTVVTGWFGMNFHHLGLLGWRHGDLVAFVIIVAIGGMLYLGLRRARWL
jgi:magnesium transporter